MACVGVSQFHLETVLRGPPPEEFDADGSGFVDLVSVEPEEGDTAVGLSYLLPRVYSLLEAPGWHTVKVSYEDIFTN
jgi:hypothetical protein